MSKNKKARYGLAVCEAYNPIPVESGILGLEVSSLQLHQTLKVATPYRDWIRRRIERYGFIEGLDFRANLRESSGGRRAKNCLVTVDVAKELAMLEENEVGRTIRRYFIEAEKHYRDWIGFWLPRLEQEDDLFHNRTGYNYTQLLMALGAGMSKTAFRSRINRNRQEFWKNQHGEWYVSDELGKNIILYFLARKHSTNIR